MDNTVIQYSTQRIDPDLLSVLDITENGKVVSAQKWTELWTLVFNRINTIDAFCLSIESLRVNWENTKDELDAKIVDFNKKYDVLEKSFIHYGEQPPEDASIKLWVQPLDNVNPKLLVSQQILQTGLNTKVDKLLPLHNNPELVLYQSELSSENKYIINQYTAAEDITKLTFILPNGGFSATAGWTYTIPAGATVTVVYSRGASANGRYAARVTIYIDTPWIVKTGVLGVPTTVSACTGYYAIDYEITAASGGAVSVSNISHKLYQAADVNIARATSIYLNSSNWSTSAPYSQVVNISNITANSKIDLTPTPEQLNTFYTKGYSFIVENKNKVVTVYCIGNKPAETYTITAAITEVAK